LTLEEFLHALEGAGVAAGHEIDRARACVTDEDAARILSFFDRDGQGVLRYNEFMRLLQGTIEVPDDRAPRWEPQFARRINELGGGPPSPAARSRQQQRDSPTAGLSRSGLLRHHVGVGSGNEMEDMRSIQDAFRQWDVNGDGFITEREMMTVLRHLDQRFSAQDVHAMFKAADANRDGAVDYQEFVAWMFR